jgi:nicotinate-nucleotide--dimethylbenzimidazole phosphoribosyltransferase
MAEFYTDAAPEPASAQAAQEKTVAIPPPEQTVRIPAPEMTPAAFIEDQLVELPPIPMEAMPVSAPAAGDDTVKIPAPVEIPGFDDAPMAEAVPEGLSSAEHASIQALLDPEPAAAPALELEPTSAPSSEVQVQLDPAFEPHSGDNAAIAIPAQDPALVTDAQELTNHFPTKFGVENAEPQPVGYMGDLPEEQAAALRAPVESDSAAAPSAAVEDDFEARVAAAMAGFEMDQPAAELEPAPVEEVAAPEPVMEAGEPGAASMDELPVATLDPLLDTSGGYQPAVMAQDAPLAEIELAPAPEPEPEPVAEAVVEPEPEPVPVAVMAAEAEEVVPSAAPEMVMAAAASAVASAPAPIIPEPQDPRAVPEGMVDAELVEQLQAAVAVMPPAPPVREEAAPVVAVGAAQPVNIVDPEIADKGAVDPQLASALAKAVGAEAPAVTSYVSAAGLDPTVVSDAVSTVLHRMLPEIVVEVIREVEAARRK